MKEVLHNMRTYKTIAISMPPELYDEIADRAGRLGLSVSAYIRLCISRAALSVEEVNVNGCED